MRCICKFMQMLQLMLPFCLVPFNLAGHVLQADGVIMLPEQAKGPGIALPSPADKICFMYLTDSFSTSSGQSSTNQPNEGSPLDAPTQRLNLNGSASSSQQSCSLLVFCQVQLQPERAMSWMQGLLQVVQAQHVLVIASLPVSIFGTSIQSFFWTSTGRIALEVIHARCLCTRDASERGVGKSSHCHLQLCGVHALSVTASQIQPEIFVQAQHKKSWCRMPCNACCLHSKLTDCPAGIQLQRT